MTLDDLNKRFEYRSDGDKDRWTILKAATGKLRGDCEDYALTVLWIEAGSTAGMYAMIQSREAELWYTHRDGETHMMLWVKGKGWIDNTHKAWSSRPRFPKEKRVTLLKFIASMVLK